MSRTKFLVLPTQTPAEHCSFSSVTWSYVENKIFMWWPAHLIRCLLVFNNNCKFPLGSLLSFIFLPISKFHSFHRKSLRKHRYIIEHDVSQLINCYSSTSIGLMIEWAGNILARHIGTPFQEDFISLKEVKQLDLPTAASAPVL